MSSYSVPSKDELGSGEFRNPLPGNEDYILSIKDIESIKKPDYNGNVRDFLKVTFSVVSFADGGALEDIDGNSTADRVLWRDIDLTKLGFMKSGTASMSRQFLIYANGITDIMEKIPTGDTEDLIGRTIIASLIVYTGNDGKQRNKIVAMKPNVQKRRRPSLGEGSPVVSSKRDTTIVEEPVTNDEYAKAVASLVNDTDEPTDEEIEQTKAALK